MSEPTTSSPYISAEQVADLVGVGTPTVLVWIDNPPPGFPTPIKLTARTIRWHREEIEAWIASRRWVRRMVGAGEHRTENQTIEEENKTSRCAQSPAGKKVPRQTRSGS